MKIGVFDSGIGGEAVAARLRELLPNAEVVTAHDRDNVPYGSRSTEDVHQLTRAAIQPLRAAGCDAIVLACNTATAAAIEQLRQEYPQLPFVGLEPMVKPAAARTRTQSVAVCATPGTLASLRYAQLKQRWAPDIHLIEPDCAQWAALIEQSESSAVDLQPLVQTVVAENADVVVLACTHYHWLKPRLQRELAEAVTERDVTVLEPSDAIAAQLTRVLEAARGAQQPLL